MGSRRSGVALRLCDLPVAPGNCQQIHNVINCHHVNRIRFLSCILDIEQVNNLLQIDLHDTNPHFKRQSVVFESIDFIDDEGDTTGDDTFFILSSPSLHGVRLA